MTAAMEGYAELPFDVTRHQEGIAAMERMGLDPKSIRAAVQARQLAVFDAPGTYLCFYSSTQSDPAHEPVQGECVVRALYTGDTAGETEAVRIAVHSYFARHFPGRTLPLETTCSPDSRYLYLRCCPLTGA